MVASLYHLLHLCFFSPIISDRSFYICTQRATSFLWLQNDYCVMCYNFVPYWWIFSFLIFFLLKKLFYLLMREIEGKKHWFVVPLIYAFIDCLLHVSSPRITPATWMCQHDAITDLSYLDRAVSWFFAVTGFAKNLVSFFSCTMALLVLSCLELHLKQFC